MKKVWMKVDPWSKEKVLTALEKGADAILLPEGGASRIRELGIIPTISPDGDRLWGKDVIPLTISRQEDVEKASAMPPHVSLVVEAKEWKVIAWENLVAKRSGIYALVKGYDEAVAAFGALEKGVEGVVIDTDDIAEATRIMDLARKDAEKLVLEKVAISRIAPLGLGDRVCVDTTAKMGKGEGMLVGNGSSGLFLIHSESLPNPYVEPRPFRVNAGAIHSYIRGPEGKTRYLSELRGGDELLIVNAEGATEITHVGRVKIERRPLVLVEAGRGASKSSCILQNAETVRLVGPSGEALSLVNLKKGDDVLLLRETGGRHLGRLVEERIEES